MQRNTRSVVAVLTALLLMNPAFACHNCGRSYGPYYGGYGYVSYGCGGYHDSCCGGTVVVDSCGCDGCGDCGCGACGCDGCGDCSSCGESDAMMHEDSHDDHAPMPAPQPPAYEPHPPTTTHKQPVAPAKPAEPAPSLPPTEMPAIPPTVPEPTPPAAEEPAELMPTPPAEMPSDDDLFSAPAPEAIPPAAEPSAPADEDDLFGPSAPAAPESSESSESTDESYNDLFGPPVEEAAPPAEEEAPPAEEEEDDFFSDAGAILRQPGGLASVELRVWNDDTGLHSCHGRLIKMLDGKVQLLKDNGRTTTVPLARLSQKDLEFVNRQASAKRSEALGQTVQVGLGR